MKTTIGHNSWIVTVPLVAAAVAYIALSFLPNRRAIGEAREQIRKKQDFIVQAGGLATALRTVEDQLVRAQAYNAAWERNAPGEGELSTFYGRINELATAAGTTLTRFDPEPAVRYEKISRVPLAIGCVGSFAQICRFLEGLERLPPVIWISELRLSRTGQEGNSVGCELTLGVFTCNPENSDYVDRSE